MSQSCADSAGVGSGLRQETGLTSPVTGLPIVSDVSRAGCQMGHLPHRAETFPLSHLVSTCRSKLPGDLWPLPGAP